MKKWESFTDNELIAKTVKNKQTEAFGELYERYKNMIYNRSLSFVDNEEEAKDVTQDIFVKTYVKLHSFKGEAKFSSWLYATTYNHCINYLQRDKALKIRNESLDFENFEKTIPDISDEDLFAIPVEKLKIVLEKVKSEEKSILLLKYQDDVSIKELQSLLNLSESAIKMRLKRAKSKVIEMYNQSTIYEKY